MKSVGSGGALAAYHEGDDMNEIERIERATQSAEYQLAAGLAGAAIAGALFAPTKEAREEALREATRYHERMAEVVRRG
jgi:ribosome recycling factor